MTRATLSLASAISASNPTRINISGARWFRVDEVPSDCYVRIGAPNADAKYVPSGTSYTMDACVAPFEDIYIDNNGVAGAGTLVILYDDGNVSMRDFLAPSGSALETVFNLDIYTAAPRNSITGLVPANVGGTVAPAIANDAATQQLAYQFGTAPGAAGNSYFNDNITPQRIVNALAPAGTARPTSLDFEEQLDVIIQIQAILTGTAYVAVGFTESGSGNPLFGFLHSNTQNFWRACQANTLNPDSRQMDTASTVNATAGGINHLRLIGGRRNGVAFCEWYANGVQFLRRTSLAAWPSFSAIRLGLYHTKTIAADTYYTRLHQFTYSIKEG